MNTKMRVANNNNKSCWQVLMLVGLLLFLPLTQAAHFNQHDTLPSDINCQICHSSIDLDGGISAAYATIMTNNAIECPVQNYHNFYQFNQTISGHIRAPPHKPQA